MKDSPRPNEAEVQRYSERQALAFLVEFPMDDPDEMDEGLAMLRSPGCQTKFNSNPGKGIRIMIDIPNRQAG